MLHWLWNCTECEKIYTKPIRPETLVLASLKWPVSYITTLKAYDPNEGICICWLYGVDLLERMTFYEFIRWKQNEHVCGVEKKRMKYYTFLFCRTSFWPRKVSISSSSSDFHWTSHSPSFNPRHFHFFLFFSLRASFDWAQIYRFFIPNDMSDIVKWMLLDCNTKKYS